MDSIVQEKQHKTIYLPGETWEKILGWMSRKHLIEVCSYVNYQLSTFSMNLLHNPIFGRRKIPPIRISRKSKNCQNNKLDFFGRPIAVILHGTNELYGEQSELPQCPIPSNIIGFKYIQFSYLDHRVIEFLRHFLPLFPDVNIVLDFNAGLHNINSLVAMKHTLLLCGRVNSLTAKLTNLQMLSEQHPRLLNESRMLAVNIGNRQSPTNMVVLNNWLNNTLEDQSPKLMVISADGKRCHDFDRFIREAFHTATQCAQFLILLIEDFSKPIICKEYRLEKSSTSELLACYKRVIPSGQTSRDCWFLRRCPIAKENDPDWPKIEDKLLEWNEFSGTRNHELVLKFKVSKIGHIDKEAEDANERETKRKRALQSSELEDGINDAEDNGVTSSAVKKIKTPLARGRPVPSPSKKMKQASFIRFMGI